MLKIEYTGQFLDQYAKLIKEEESTKELVLHSVKWFRKNPNDTRLENHELHKSMEGKWAFSVAPDIRIVYEWFGKTTVRFLAVGPHRHVYKK